MVRAGVGVDEGRESVAWATGREEVAGALAAGWRNVLHPSMSRVESAA